MERNRPGNTPFLTPTLEAMVSIKSADAITFNWLGSEGVVAGGVLRSWKTDTSLRKDEYSMSKLSALIAEARTGLSIQESISEASWEAIAIRCRDEEIADIGGRIEALKLELASVEEWDGDAQDEINVAISKFSYLLKLASANA